MSARPGRRLGRTSVRAGGGAATPKPSTGSARTLTAKLVAPAPSRSLVPRPELGRRLGEALAHRLTVVVANAGFGKSTLLATWAAGRRACWYTLTPEDAALGALARGLVDALRLRVPGLPAELAAVVGGSGGPESGVEETDRADAFAAMLCDALAQRVRRDLVLVLDDLHELGGSAAAARLVEGLCRQAPPSLHLVVASRAELPFRIDRLRGSGQVLELAGADLAFRKEETAALASAVLGEEAAAELAADLHEVAGGWPAAIRLAIEGLAGTPADERAAVLERLREPGGPLYAYLAAEVFERERDEVRELVRTVAPLDVFTADLCVALGVTGAEEILASLARRGLFLDLHGPLGWFTLGSLVREFASVHLPLSPGELRRVHLRAARWYEEAGEVEAALRSLAEAREEAGTARVLAAHGTALLGRGAPAAVLEAAGRLPADARDPGIEQLVGDAEQMLGDWDAALASFARAAAGAAALGPGLAWRMGMIHHLRGRLDEAFEVYRRGVVDGSAPADEALLLAWTASAHWLRGDGDACRELAQQAFARATESGDPRGLAAAHTVLALVAALEGDRAANDAHYLRAIGYAEQAGDVLQQIRIHVNRGSRHTEEGDYEEALAELELAIQLADLAGFGSWRALALNNRGEAKSQLGLLDEAVADLEEAAAIYQRLGSRMIAYPLGHLGTVYRQRGDTALARAAYEEARASAEEAEDLQGLVPALAGLARLLARRDPGQAAALAERAVAYGPGMGYVQALLARGRVALERGDPVAAARAAEEAAAAARGRRDRAGLAEALELAATADDPALAAPPLEEARAIWRELGNPLGEARAELALARVSERPAARELAARAERRLRELGARAHAAAAADLLAELDREARAPVEIRTLGAFEVVCEGERVPPARWQSKKARDLLKLLVARRGHATPRDVLMETLWPGQPPEALPGRLSVALATVRSALDPEKRHDRDHFVAAGKDVVKLRLDQVSVDVERFLSEAAAGLAAWRNGAPDDATELLALAEASYTGDFLEEDLYEEWAVNLREEARSAYVEVARALAEDAVASGDAGGATKYFLRVLERDAYDEQAHLGLVSALAAAGRHGEAHRFYRAYAARMEEIGVEAAPFPGRPRP